MSVVTKVLSSLIIIPGLGGTGYVAYEALKPYPEHVQKIYDLEKKHGGCQFGLANSFDSKTGGFPSQAIGSSLDKKEGQHHKLEKVHEDIETDSKNKIKEECKKRGPGKILELSGQNTAWEFKENQTGTEHNLPAQ